MSVGKSLNRQPLPQLAQPPPPTQPPPPARHAYQDYTEENPHFSSPRRPRGRPSPPCFLCGEEGHLAANCPACSALQRLLHQPTPVRLLEGSSEAMVAQVGCMVGPPITGQLTLEGIPVLGLVDTGASVTCLGFNIWWRYHAQWGPLKPFEGTVHGAHGKPLQIAGKTQHLGLQWGEARGRACFIIIVGLESPPCLIGKDIMRPLRVRIDVTNGTATPAQPVPQTVHLNPAQQQQQRMKKPLPRVIPPAPPPLETSPPAVLSAAPAAPAASPPAPASPELAPPSATPHTTSRAPNSRNSSGNRPSRPLPQPVAYRGRLFLFRGRSTGVCDWHPCAL